MEIYYVCSQIKLISKNGFELFQNFTNFGIPTSKNSASKLFIGLTPKLELEKVGGLEPEGVRMKSRILTKVVKVEFGKNASSSS
jgi:hypothetical protein